MQSLSFIFLADGPCSDVSWRPNEDKTMYWARRDALVRITALALWQATGVNHGCCDDCIFLFNKEDDPDSDPAVITVHGPSITAITRVPSEAAIVRGFKNATIFATKYPQKARIGDRPSKSTHSRSISSAVSDGSCEGISCSLSPWKEAGLFSSGGAAATVSVSGAKKGTSGATIPPSAETSCEDFDKRSIVKLLQQKCPIEFLRKYGLNGQETLILKKCNKATIMKAHQAWLQECSSSSSDTPVDAVSSDASFPGKVMSSSRRMYFEEDSREARLVQTFQVLLQRCKGSDKSENVTVLFLHEDYPNELQVFGSTSSQGSQLGNGDDVVPAPQRTNEGYAAYNNNAGSSRVVCILGAVRDASDVEVRAAVLAAQSMGIRCVGANLGRTAEFTSKIVAALGAHAICSRLAAAAAALPSIDLNTVAESSAKSSGTSKPSSSSTTSFPTSVPVITKLVPIRDGGWSWDGKSNKTTSAGARIHTTTTEAFNGIENGHVAGAPAAARTSSSSYAAAAAVSSTGGTSALATNAQGVRSVDMHVVLWLPYDAAYVSEATERREQLQSLVQTIVCTLWRSRLASEAAAVTATATAQTSASYGSGVDSDIIDGDDNDLVIDAESSSNNIDRGREKNNKRKKTDSEIGSDDHEDLKRKTKKPKSSSSTNFTATATSTSSSLLSDESVAKNSSKPLVSPTLSMVFVDGTTVTVTQQQLSLRMAQRHMAAPSEYQVITVLKEIISESSRTRTSAAAGERGAEGREEGSTSSATVPVVEVNEMVSRSLGDKDANGSLAIGGSRGGSRGGGGGNATSSRGTVIRRTVAATVQELLPTTLRKSQRKAFRVVEIAGILDSSSKNRIPLAVQQPPPKQQQQQGDSCAVIRDDENVTANLLPCLAEVAYAESCSCFTTTRGRSDKSAVAAAVASSSAAKHGHPDLEEENKSVADHRDLSEEEEPFRVMFLLRPPRTVTTDITTSRAATASISDDAICSSSADHMHNSREEGKSLCDVLNQWVYGGEKAGEKKKNKKEEKKEKEMKTYSKIFAKASVLLPIASNGNGTKATTASSVIPPESSTVSVLSPGAAVAILQHWAYHGRLQPAINAVVKSYYNSSKCSL